MTSVVALPIIATGQASTAQPEIPHDAVLIGLANQLTSFMPEFFAVRERFNRAEQEYFSRRPPQPQAWDTAAAHDEYLRQCALAKTAVGFDQAREEYNRASGYGRELENAITDMPAHTLAGVKSKAAALVAWCWEGDLDGAIDTEDLLRSIIRDLAAGTDAPVAPAATANLPVPLAA